MKETEISEKTLRLDKWLWYARQVKTRSKAARLVQEGKVRVNRDKVSKPSHGVRPGDTITAVVGSKVRVLEVVELGARRGPASEAETLYIDLSPAPPPSANTATANRTAARREPGSGRPTKRERRLTDRLRHRALYDGEA